MPYNGKFKKKETTMALEDKYLIGTLIFCILFTASFGWGWWG